MTKQKIENVLYDYITAYCVSNNINIDCRFQCFGDVNKYYTRNQKISINCVTYHYYAFDIDGIKDLFKRHIDTLWNEFKAQNNRIGLYIENITETERGYTIIMGGCLFYDQSVPNKE